MPEGLLYPKGQKHSPSQSKTAGGGGTGEAQILHLRRPTNPIAKRAMTGHGHSDDGPLERPAKTTAAHEPT